MPEKVMIKPHLLKKIGFLLLILLILSYILKQSFYLRSIGYDQIPETSIILDERTNIWHGLSIRKSGIPAAWSNLEAYKSGSGGEIDGLNLKVSQNYQPTFINLSTYPKPIRVIHEFDYGKGILHTPFVQPYLDHPPLGALVLSSFVKNQVKTFDDLTPADFRRGSLYLGVLTGGLIFLLGWQISKNPFIGLMSAAIYGSVPTFNLLSRYALLENVLNPLMLMVLNLLIFAKSLIEKNPKSYLFINWLLFFAGMFSGLMALTKIIGWFMLIVGVLFLYTSHIKAKKILLFVIPALVIGLLYLVWGLYLDPKLFMEIVFYQGVNRGFIGSLNFLTTLKGVSIANFPSDGWWIGGFLALFMISYKKEYILIIFTTASYLVMTFLLGGANYPWYYMPLIPLMSIATSFLIWKVAKEPNFILIMIFFLVFFSSSFYWGYGVFQADKLSTNYMQPYLLYRLLLIIFFSAALYFTLQASSNKSLFLKIWFIFILMVVYQLWKWNSQSILYILSHWGKFPSLYTPGTF